MAGKKNRKRKKKKGGLLGGFMALIAGGLGFMVLGTVLVLVCATTLITAMVQAEYGQLCVSDTSSSSWVAVARRIAQDDKHGYSEPNRGGHPDFDCSSLVWYSLKESGIDVGSSPFTTYSMGPILEKAGFEKVAFDRNSLQAGDILVNPTHTEIYEGDNKVISADWDENHSTEGLIPGDQHGDEILERPLYESFQTVYRRKGGVAQAASGSTGADAKSVVGMTHDQVMAWFGGKAGPDNVCASYVDDNCTWYACQRAYKLGWKHVGTHWGNGADWGRSAAAEGYKTNQDAPVPGALMSVPAGLLGSDISYGHVLVVESVDTAKGTITTSEKGAGYNVYSHTYPIRNGGTYILPKDPINGASSGSTGSCSTGSGDTGDANGDKASPDQAKAIAKKKLSKYGWGDDQYECLVPMWTRESGWRWDADNPTSDAYGIPQSLPGSKMASAGQDWKTNAATQIEWGLNYIKGRYGTPCQAWAFWQAHNWY